FRFLCERFPLTTGLSPLSLDHKRIIERTQAVMLGGGRELFIMFRGAAKTTITENAAIWCAGYGHRAFFVPVAATEDMAKSYLASIQFEFETSDELMEIFPAACHAARSLEGVPQRAPKQTIGGRRTYIQWNSKRCVLPTVAEFSGSGCIIWPRGITSRGLRGLRFKRPDGRQARPDFYMGDDLQTDESATSPAQNSKRLNVIRKTILRGGSHTKKLSIVVNATIIEPDDAIDQLSDRKKFPGWRTLKVPMLKSFSKAHEKEWLGKYAELLTSYDSDNDADRDRAERDANAYYAGKRKTMDAGAEATWESCFDPDHELSAIQHAYNILILDGEDSFMAECQNEPVRQRTSIEILTPDQICRKQSDFTRGQFPKEASTLVAFVDCHEQILYAEVWAFEPNFSGYRIDDPTYPDQRRKYFAHRSISRRLKQFFPGLDEEAALVAGLNAFLHGHEDWLGLMRKEWIREDGVPMRIRCCLVDANGTHRDAIVKAVSRSEFAASLHPSFGIGITAKKAPISSWSQTRKQKIVGPEWIFTEPKAGEVAGIAFDANYWKARFHRGLTAPKGSQGCLLLHKCHPSDHRLTADHYSAEKPTEVTVGSRTVAEFAQKPNTDNHRHDCGVGAMVAASRCGVTNVKAPLAARPRRKSRTTYYG
ncbi:MAG TPA: terminase gpA endonuclease subunit, partial [Methyloceanibacter sp.]|nr:terminase gpA endonuclease subunit [Methyloceanibacter sp.]